ncbi:MAG: hypothetical protein ACEQSF_03765 [Solirubrobacteraceae bacterium]
MKINILAFFCSLLLFLSCISTENFDIPKIEKDILIKNSISCLNESFNNYEVNSNQFNNLINHVSKGGKLWTVQKFIANNGYLESSAYGINKKMVHQLLIPIDFTKADAISFLSKDGYYNGNPLKIYYTTQFQIDQYRFNEVLDTSNSNIFTDITNNFAISNGSTDGYAKKFINSGIYTFPKNNTAVTGFLIFEYSNMPISGKEYITTTIQIDDIIILDNETLNCK